MRLFSFIKNPLVAAVLAGAAGLFVGLVILGWQLWPVEWVDAAPEALSQGYQEEYLRMTIDSFGVNQDAELALERWESIGPSAARLFVAIADNPRDQKIGDILALKALAEKKYGSITELAKNTPVGTSGGQPSAPTNIKLFLVLGLLLVLIGIGVYGFARRFLVGRNVSPEQFSPARQAQEINRNIERTDFGQKGVEKPITQTMTTYVLGDDLYDESFSIDTGGGEFLGEYGVGISEAIGVGEPKKVTAIEIWLFDKNDIKTATKVLMSPHAFRDGNIRQRLEAKGELVELQPQAQVLLETQTLQLLATVVDIDFGQGSMPEHSFFERITLELAVWPK